MNEGLEPYNDALWQQPLPYLETIIIDYLRFSLYDF